MFGFIGLPTLGPRAGVNLMGMLRLRSYDYIEEVELNSLLLAVTGNVLRTTRDARQHVARTSGNMFILRSIVTNLLEHVSIDRRAWINFNDAVAVESELCRRLREGKDDGVSNYIRDALNDADEINEWKPNAAMPLAIALAEANAAGASTSNLWEEASKKIQQWYDSMPDGNSTRLTYDGDRQREHRAVLDEKHIFQNGEFTSSLLESWLAGYRRRISEESWNAMLVQAAIRRVRTPEVIKEIEGSSGAQARIGIFTRDSKKFAYRSTELRTDEDRAKFAETCGMLERLKSAVDDRAQGSEYIFQLHDFGLSAEDASKAVQTYRWIEGVDLGERVNLLSEAYVADLGVKLARAVRFLHQHGVLHRDLSPRNVIIQNEGGNPIIVDFGFARSLGSQMLSNINTEFSAPEVRNRPAWSEAADIYALAATLKRVLKRVSDRSALHSLLASCLAERPSDRPDAQTLAREFEAISKSLALENRKEAAWNAVKLACATEYAQTLWFRTALEKFSGNFKSAALGCYDAQFDRCLETATFLNQLFEAYASSAALSSGTTLGTVGNSKQWSHLSTGELSLIYALRNHDGHSKLKPSFTVAKFRADPSPQQRKRLMDGAKQLAEVVKIACLPDVITHLLDPPPLPST